MPATMTPCTYTGSYYDQTPWTESACAADETVPAGCPVHFVIGAQLQPADVMVERVGSDGTTTPLPSTTTLVDTVSQGFTLPDEFSCDCAPSNVTIDFGRYAVAVPDAQPGDTISLVVAGAAPFTFQIAAAGTCPAPDWPSEYDVALACDPCPHGDPLPGDPPPGDMPGGGGHGCAAGGDPCVLLAVLLLPLVRRRRR